MIDNGTATELEELLLEDVLTDIGTQSQIVVYNDDHNTFDWVIDCFVNVLKHSSVQAEQLSMMIHFKGKASVKTAPRNVLKPFKDSLTEKGLSAVIEELAD